MLVKNLGDCSKKGLEEFLGNPYKEMKNYKMLIFLISDNNMKQGKLIELAFI